MKTDAQLRQHRLRMRKWRKNNSERARVATQKSVAKWRESNRQICRDRNNSWAAENREAVSAGQKNWRTRNRNHVKTWSRAYTHERRKCPKYRLCNNLRKRCWHALKGHSKSASTLKLLGCSVEHLRAHLESLFQPGMSWENYGEWHVDHIKPCDSFDLTDPEQQRACFCWTNLQPLWRLDNIRKGTKRLANPAVAA